MSRINQLPDGWQKKRLEKVAIIQTGIAKNQNSKHKTLELPYLRVANVQDGFLDLSEIKTINIHKDKVNRYRLEYGDVLLTEGGDFDKLGRGAVWKDQIQNCLHQNHVFVVRSNKHELLPSFFSAQTGSFYGKKYFLSCSKQSTNLASINSSQLKAYPVLLPPLCEQKAIADLLSTWDEAIENTERLIRMKEKQFKWLLRELISEPRNTQKNSEWKRVKIGAFLTESRIPDRENDPQKKLKNKAEWSTTLKLLIELRKTGSIRDVLELLKETSHPKLSAKVASAEKRLSRITEAEMKDEEISEADQNFVEKIRKIEAVSYLEVMNLFSYVEDKTPFSTKHGVKGAEFDEVLVVCGRGWNHYNWNQFLEWFEGKVPPSKQDAYERNRNLFYVSCSRAKKKLALLFTQELSATTLQQVEHIFGKDNVHGEPGSSLEVHP